MINSETLLAQYPFLWNYLQSQRKEILYYYHSSSDVGSGVRSSFHSDPTAGRGIKLAQLGERKVKIILAGQWIDGKLRPEDRPVLIKVWRGCGLRYWEVVRWQTMVHDLGAFLKAYAGRASDEHGIAYASGRSIEQPIYKQ